MWSLIKSLGAAVRLLAPTALLALICGRDSPIMRMIHHWNKSIQQALFPSPNLAEGVLKWLQEEMPGDPRTESLDAVWADGSVLCQLIDSVVPGSCSGHPHEVDLMHGQRLAEQYLGIRPLFSSVDLNQKVLSTYQECRLSHYLECVRDAITCMSPPVSRTGSPILNTQAFTLDYVVRGMGIITAYKNKKATFYIYPTAQQSLEPRDISVQIKGPNNCYGSILIPAILGKTHIMRNAFLNLDNRKNSINLPLPLAQGAAYMRSYENIGVETKFFIPKIKNDIEMSSVIKHDGVKISYTPTKTGIHDLSLISNGCHLIGSPFRINVEIGSLERHESSDYVDEDMSVEQTLKPERKIVFRIVDFITEKMILTDDGRLEKISNEDADALLQHKGSIEDLTEKFIQLSKKLAKSKCPDVVENNDSIDDENIEKCKKLNKIIQRVQTLLQVCKEFHKVSKNKENGDIRNEDSRQNMNSTPDIVNSTIITDVPYDTAPISNRESAKILRQKFKNKLSSFNDTNASSEKFDGKTKNKSRNNDEASNLNIYKLNKTEDKIQSSTPDMHTGEVIYKKMPPGASIEIIVSSFEDDEIIIPRKADLVFPILEELPERPKSPIFSDIPDRPISPFLANIPKSPFLTDIPERPKSPFLADIPERPKSPFLADVPERPKSPIFKVLENDIESTTIFNEFEHFKIDEMFDSLEDPIDNYCPHTDKALNFNIFEDNDGKISPSIDFHIGEAVTPTRDFNSLISLEADMDSIILASNLEEALVKYDIKLQKSMNEQNQNATEDSNSSIFSTSNRQTTAFEKMTDSEILLMYEVQTDIKKIDDSSEDKEKFIKQEYSVDCEDEIDSIHDFNIQKGRVNIVRQTGSNNEISIKTQESFFSDDEDRIPVFLTHNTETWDSAYISIDEINSSPDTNSNSSRSDCSHGRKLFCIEENDLEYNINCDKNIKFLANDYFNKIGPAEQEIMWKNKAKIEIEKEKNFNCASNKSQRKKSKSYKDSKNSNEMSIQSIEEDFSKITESKAFDQSLDPQHVDEDKPCEVFVKNDDNDLEKLYYENKSFKNQINQKELIKYNSTKHLSQDENKIDDSASDCTADVKRSTKTNNKDEKITPDGMISLIQTIDAESKDVSQNLMSTFCEISKLNIEINVPEEQHDILKQTNKKNNRHFAKKPLISKMISEKKDYWDNKIKIWQKRDEKRNHANVRKKNCHLNDSLGRKRGKQVLSKIPSITEKWINSFDPQNNSQDNNRANHKSIVVRWKEYWNERAELENNSKYKHETMNTSNHKIPIMDILEDKQNKCDIADSYSTSILSQNMSQNKDNIFERKYQPKPINLMMLTQRIDRFLETLSNPSPIIELEESRFSTPDCTINNMCTREIIKHDNLHSKGNTESNLVKIEKNKDRLNIVWNESSNEKRIIALKNISGTSTPDINNENKINSLSVTDSINKNCKIEKKLGDITNIDNIHIKTNNKVDLEIYESFPGVADIKAKIEQKHQMNEAKEFFLKHKSKTIDIPTSYKISKLKKCFSLDQVDRNPKINKMEYSKFDRSLSSHNLSNKIRVNDTHILNDIDWQKSNESIPSLSSRKAKLEKHLQTIQRNAIIKPDNKESILENEHVHSNKEATYECIDKNVIKSTKMDSYVTMNDEEKKVFKSINDIVRAFESKQTFQENNLNITKNTNVAKFNRQTNLPNKLEKPYLDAEKREGTTENLQCQTSQSAMSQPINPSNGMNDLKSDRLKDSENKNLAADTQELEKTKSKERFLQAKQFFQTLHSQKQNYQPTKKPNECEILLCVLIENNLKDTEVSLENKKNQYLTDLSPIEIDKLKCEAVNCENRRIKTPRKAFSAPTSDTEYEIQKKEWLQRSSKLKKISEKFQVEGLFRDIVGEGNGSFKGIPHKKAVLDAFRSMENVTQLTSYEYTVSQMEDFAKKNGIVNAQTYHSEFPYLPLTEPGKYRARYDPSALGLIRRSDLLKKYQKGRRYSAPSEAEMHFNYRTSV